MIDGYGLFCLTTRKGITSIRVMVSEYNHVSKNPEYQGWVDFHVCRILLRLQIFSCIRNECAFFLGSIHIINNGLGLYQNIQSSIFFSLFIDSRIQIVQIVNLVVFIVERFGSLFFESTYSLLPGEFPRFDFFQDFLVLFVTDF